MSDVVPLGPRRAADVDEPGWILVLGRAIAYATLFVSLALVFLPARILAWSAVTRPAYNARRLPAISERTLLIEPGSASIVQIWPSRPG